MRIFIDATLTNSVEAEMARKKRISRVVHPQHNPSSEGSEPLFTIEDAFSTSLLRKVPEVTVTLPGGALYTPDRDLAERHFDIERGIRAIAFLLGSATEDGNKSLEGQAAAGLGALLQCYADEIDRLEDARRFRVTQTRRPRSS